VETESRSKRLVRPEDLLKDDQQILVSQGVTIRKGTIGAFMQNAQIFSAPDRPAEERAAARKLLVAYALDIIAMNIDRQVTWRDPEIEKIMAAARTGATRPRTTPDPPQVSRKEQPPAKEGSAQKLLVEGAPALVALGMDQVMKWKEPEIQRILDQARMELFPKGAHGTQDRS
jgi:hypothetical protein